MILPAFALVACAFPGFSAPPGGAPAQGFVGTLVYSPNGAPTAAVVVLHGSEGGQAPFAPWIAHHFAEQGFIGASFCWFGCEGLPQAVDRVSLDRTVEFLRWFRAGPAKDLSVVVYGASRGAEHALLLASLLADDDLIDGLASHAGSDTVVAAFDPATGGPVMAEGGYDAAWTWKGEPLYGERAMPFGSGPRIAIEKYPGPVWLSHGEADPLWPVERSRKLASARGALPTELHTWPGEGHIVQSPKNTQAFLDSLDAFVRGVHPSP